ncbi:hypothetical protein RFF05_07900 [Bengtsoniella intestinalis]|uniref:hypothetical protein n=1 Tax=Bengtsoniella intestinalis TaxID=3073143 RepID=UPI00391FBB87
MGFTLTLLRSEYCVACHEAKTTPYMYIQFCEKYRRWARVTRATMRITHKPGEAMQVDWAGVTKNTRYEPALWTQATVGYF